MIIQMIDIDIHMLTLLYCVFHPILINNSYTVFILYYIKYYVCFGFNEAFVPLQGATKLLI